MPSRYICQFDATGRGAGAEALRGSPEVVFEIGAGSGGSARILAFGPHALQTGSRSISKTTAVQEACRADGVLIRIAHNTMAVVAAISIALTAQSINNSSILLTSLLAGANDFLQPVEFALTQNFGFHHTAHQLLHRALAKAVDDLPHRASRQAARR